MSGEASPLIDALNRRVTELTTELADTRAEAKKYRLERKQLKVDLEKATGQVTELTKDRDTWKQKAEAAPSDLQGQVDKLTGELRTRDHGEAWKTAIGDQLADGVPITDVWSKLDYKPGEKVPTAEEIKTAFAALKDKAAYMVKTGTESGTDASRRGTKGPTLSTETQASRGAPDTSTGRVTVRNSDLRNMKWALDPANQKMLQDARKAGNLHIVED